MKIIFFGTSEFSLIILKRLIKEKYLPALILTMPDKPVGRKQIVTASLIKQFALKNKFKTIQPINLKESISEIKDLKPDLGILASFGKIIPLEILNIPRHGFINVHPSLLPKYRGASPIQTTIANNDQETGVTIIKMIDKIDQGPIINSQKITITNKKITYQELHNELAELGAELLIKAISKLLNQEIELMIQDESKASYTKIIKKQDGRIDWQNSAEKIEREIRAFYLWPGSYTTWKQKIIKIKQADVLKDNYLNNSPIGETSLLLNNKIAVKCKKDFLIIEKIQIQGKKEMNIEDFLRGHKDFINTKLE